MGKTLKQFSGKNNKLSPLSKASDNMVPKLQEKKICCLRALMRLKRLTIIFLFFKFFQYFN